MNARLNKVNSRIYQLTTVTQQVWLWFTLSILTLFHAKPQNVQPWMIFILFLTHQARYDQFWHISQHCVTSRPVSYFVSSHPAFNVRARLLGNRKAFIHHGHKRQNWESEENPFRVSSFGCWLVNTIKY